MKPSTVMQRGFATIVALFLLVVLAGLGAAMVSLSSSQQIGSALDIQGSRAYWAAKAGIEWALGTLAQTPAPVPPAVIPCPTPPSPFVVDGFTVVVTCAGDAVQFDDNGTQRTVYNLTSRAWAGGAIGGTGYVERSVSAAVEF
ncbi:MAG: hypothetical protein KA164_05125 [Rhodoferax sp.]|nr:hypothetical protein [Rhodoferax sp.]